MRKIFFGLIWFVVLYFGFALSIGFGMGFVYALQHPEVSKLPRGAAYEIGRELGRKNVRRIVPISFGAAVTLSIAGSAFGVLPGTRSRRRVVMDEYASFDVRQPTRTAL